MRCPTPLDLPPPPAGKTGWPWTEESPQLPDIMSDPSTTLRTPGSPWPRVSIVTPSYNQGRFIEEAIRSVLLQGYPDLEYIIIDGCSTDGSVDIIRKYEPWLAYWVSEPDRGQSHAINKGLEKSTGQLFNWHNSDDVLTPNSLATTVTAIVNHPEASYVYGYVMFIDSQSSVLLHSDNHPLLRGKSGFILPTTWSVANLKGGRQPGCLMDRALVARLGGVDENLYYAMDVDLTLRLALIRPSFYIHYPVVYFRVHPRSKSCSKYAERAEDRLYIARKLFQRRDLPPEINELRSQAFATAHSFALINYVEAKMYSAALWHFLQNVVYSAHKARRVARAIPYLLDVLCRFRNQIRRFLSSKD